MYKFIVNTHFGEIYFESSTREFPKDEFIRGRNSDWEIFYINRKEILFYQIRKIEWENKN